MSKVKIKILNNTKFWKVGISTRSIFIIPPLQWSKILPLSIQTDDIHRFSIWLNMGLCSECFLDPCSLSYLSG